MRTFFISLSKWAALMAAEQVYYCDIRQFYEALGNGYNAPPAPWDTSIPF